MQSIARLVCVLLAACGVVAAICLVAGSPDAEGPFTPRVLVAACGIGALSLLMYLLVLRRQGKRNGTA